MKKLFILGFIAVFVSVGHGAIIEAVIYGGEDNGTVGELGLGDILYIAIISSEPLDAYDFGISVSGPGALFEIDGGPNVNHVPGSNNDGFWLYSGIAQNNIDRIADGWLEGSSQPGPLVWGLGLYVESSVGCKTIDILKGQGDTRVVGSGYILQEADFGCLDICAWP